MSGEAMPQANERSGERVKRALLPNRYVLLLGPNGAGRCTSRLRELRHWRSARCSQSARLPINLAHLLWLNVLEHSNRLRQCLPLRLGFSCSL